jgi:DNA polymerase III epsilon subunit-like protein
MPKDLVFIDVETAALRGAPHLVELGAVRVREGEVVDSLSSLVAPEVEVDPEATELHGLCLEDLFDAPAPGEVLALLEALSLDAWLCAYGARYEALALGFAYARAERAPPETVLLDALPLARVAFPAAPDHKLETLVELLHIDSAPRHRALPDAVAAWQVAEHAARALGEDALPQALAHHGPLLSIAGALPSPPRRAKQRIAELVRAASDKRSVTLIYGAPPSAPARLSVEPRLLYESHGKGYLEGICPLSGTLKTYRLDRVQKVLP